MRSIQSKFIFITLALFAVACGSKDSESTEIFALLESQQTANSGMEVRALNSALLSGAGDPAHPAHLELEQTIGIQNFLESSCGDQLSNHLEQSCAASAGGNDCQKIAIESVLVGEREESDLECAWAYFNDAGTSPQLTTGEDDAAIVGIPNVGVIAHMACLYLVQGMGHDLGAQVSRFNDCMCDWGFDFDCTDVGLI